MQCRKRRAWVSLFDHLVGALLELRWHVQAECFRSFEIDCQHERNWGLDGKVARLLALEDAIGILCCAPKIINRFISVREQAADFSIEAERTDGRQAVASRQRCDFRAMGVVEGIWHNDKTPIGLACVGGNYGF